MRLSRRSLALLLLPVLGACVVPRRPTPPAPVERPLRGDLDYLRERRLKAEASE